jgi:hypothetical protein
VEEGMKKCPQPSRKRGEIYTKWKFRATLGALTPPLTREPLHKPKSGSREFFDWVIDNIKLALYVIGSRKAAIQLGLLYFTRNDINENLLRSITPTLFKKRE